MSEQFTEIERKFLLDSFPKGLLLKEEFQVYMAYLSIDPEVRIRRNVKDGQDVAHYLAIKSDGDMVRKEVETEISTRHFYALAEMVSEPFITKDFRVYQLPDGLELECSQVDKGFDTEFFYAEVEFPSVEAAEAFKPLPSFRAEVTSDSSYKMKNFWKRTRGQGGIIMNDPLKRRCHVCGKPLSCDCYHSDYGLVKLDGKGNTLIEFDACGDCLSKIVDSIRKELKFKEWVKIEYWCDNQCLDENGVITCLAHLAEARALTCPYKTNEERLTATYPCSDYEPVTEAR